MATRFTWDRFWRFEATPMDKALNRISLGFASYNFDVCLEQKGIKREKHEFGNKHDFMMKMDQYQWKCNDFYDSKFKKYLKDNGRIVVKAYLNDFEKKNDLLIPEAIIYLIGNYCEVKRLGQGVEVLD